MIVGIFYHARTAAVHKADNIILAVAEVEILRAVVIDADYIAAGFIAEQQRLLRRNLRHEQAGTASAGYYSVKTRNGLKLKQPICQRYSICISFLCVDFTQYRAITFHKIPAEHRSLRALPFFV